MKWKWCSDEQIAFALRQAVGGTTVEEICRKPGVSEPTFTRWNGGGEDGLHVGPAVRRPPHPDPDDRGHPHTRGTHSTPRANFRAAQAVEVLDQLMRVRGKPRSLRVDNGPGFAGRLLDHWARLTQGSVRRSRMEWRDEGHLNKVEIDFSRPGKPTDDAFIEAFDARLRAECLNAAWFLSPADARTRIEEWRQHTNEERPHSAQGNLTSRALANQAGQAREVAQHPGQSQGQDRLT